MSLNLLCRYLDEILALVLVTASPRPRWKAKNWLRISLYTMKIEFWFSVVERLGRYFACWIYIILMNDQMLAASFFKIRSRMIQADIAMIFKTSARSQLRHYDADVLPTSFAKSGVKSGLNFKSMLDLIFIEPHLIHCISSAFPLGRYPPGS